MVVFDDCTSRKKDANKGIAGIFRDKVSYMGYNSSVV